MSTFTLLARTSLLKRNNIRQFSLLSPQHSSPSVVPPALLFSKKSFSVEAGEQDLKKKKNKKNSSELEGKYSSTIRLPASSFSQRANSLEKEPELQSFWTINKTYEEILKKNKNGEDFVLHDGPPYANGDLHTGHALNKVLKDIINRHQLLQGKKAVFVPGWDCHGLPIEFKVLQNLKKEEKQNLTPIRLRQIAENYARSTVEDQKKQFQRLGIWALWDTPYLTLAPEYEAEQIKIFGQMYRNGHIYRGTKPVYWSPSSRTALAEAELEYNDKHVSKSMYLGFQVDQTTDAFNKFLAENNISSAKDIQLLIWTTTPWTIPSNLAISVGPNIEYSLVSSPEFSGGAKFLVAKDLIPTLLPKFNTAKFGATEAGTEPKELTFNISETSILGKDLGGVTYKHPLVQRVSPVLVGGDYISTDSGTGLVHTAPGHGLEDYLTGLKNGIPPFSPVNEAGCYTKEVGDDELVGLDVLSTGNDKVIEKLKGLNSNLIFVENYTHKYPYDWRTKKPTIFRATEQWFASLKEFRDETLSILHSEIEFVPPKSKNLLSNMIENREDWCISRQRNWGVPIPAFYHKDTREVLLDDKILVHVEAVFKEKGSNAWWELSTEELLPAEYKHMAADYVRGYDTMDVWFDSGTSWGGVLKNRGLKFPADLYLEGNDQARGWFQSSLLTAVSTQKQSPYKSVLTHGMVLDEKGNKMSKSLGNVINPLEIILGNNKNLREYPPYGADTLRLWVSSTDYTGDVNIGQNIIKKTNENYRKIRLTFKYILGCLNDFQPPNGTFDYSAPSASTQIRLEDLEEIDQYILLKLNKLTKEIETYYNSYQFSKINYSLLQFISQDLSSFYLNISKDRLYISEKESFRLQSCQYTLSIILDQLMTLLAPILPHLTEEIYQSLPYKVTREGGINSVFENKWITNEFYKKLNVENKKFHEIFKKDSETYEEDLEANWDMIKKLRNDFNKCVEIDIKNKKVSTSMENEFFVYFDESDKANADKNRALKDYLAKLQEKSAILNNNDNFVNDFRFLFLCSKFEILNTKEEFISKIKESNSEFFKNEDDVTLDILLNHKEYSSNLPKNFLTKDTSESSVFIGIKKTEAKKCERCWYYCSSVGSQVHDDLCHRCSTIVDRQAK